MARAENKISIRKTADGNVASVSVGGVHLSGVEARLASTSQDAGITSIDVLVITVPLGKVTIEEPA